MPDDLEISFARLEGKIDTILFRMDHQDKTTEKLESRIDALEKRVWTFTGAASVIGAALSAMGSKLLSLLT